MTSDQQMTTDLGAAPDDLAKPVDVDWPMRNPGRFVPIEIFGRTSPLELEIGFGKGRFLLRSAIENPERDFIGIEVAAKYFRLARQRALKRNLTNIRLICGDAKRFVEEVLPDRSLDRVHVYFPDPWPKRRQHKRRLLDPLFVHALAKKLRTGGEVRLATDHADYYAEIVLSFGTEPLFVESPRQVEPAEGLTNYEVKYRLEGRAIYRSVWALPDAG